MARIAGKKDQLTMAREVLRKAMTANELRAAQAVVIPLELGLSIAQTAIVIGRSVGCDLHYAHTLFQDCSPGGLAACQQMAISQPGSSLAGRGKRDAR